jgi:hypothetical protein
MLDDHAMDFLFYVLFMLAFIILCGRLDTWATRPTAGAAPEKGAAE